MNEILLRNERFRASIAVPMSVTVRMPMTMPKVVSTERILLARMAPQEMRRPSLSSVNKFTLAEAQSAKIQAPEKHQIPNTKPCVGDLALGVWSFSGAWRLVLG